MYYLVLNGLGPLDTAESSDDNKTYRMSSSAARKHNGHKDRQVNDTSVVT